MESIDLVAEQQTECAARLESSAGPRCTLDCLLPGDRAQICGLRCADRSLYLKLLTMGIVPGRVVEISCEAPFGDPIAIRAAQAGPAGSYPLAHDLSLRLSEARTIEVTPLRG